MNPPAGERVGRLVGRAGHGQAFIFDPNHIYRLDPQPDFVFNPLEYIRSGADARELAAFITSTDTLVLLSKDGEGSGGAILTALIRAICKTAETAA